MNKYIDIHTHHDNTDVSIISIKSVIAGINTPTDNNWFSAGIHPWYLNENYLTELEKLVTQPNCLAVGECGLDMMPSIIKKYSLQYQKKIFLAQAELAEQYQKPLIIHCVKCFDKLSAIKKSFNPKVPWIIHGFNKGKELAGQLTDAGFYLSFGSQLFAIEKNCKALQSTPLNRIFLETDEQTTYNINHIYQKVAKITNIDLHDLQRQIHLNFTEIFKVY